jgi:hypothetical protein
LDQNTFNYYKTRNPIDQAEMEGRIDNGESAGIIKEPMKEFTLHKYLNYEDRPEDHDRIP